MKNRLLPIFLVSILFSCTRTADIESVAMSVETQQQTVLPKISKDVDFLSADDAVKVANLFNHGNVLTKSETLKEVKSVVPVKDENDRTLIYAVNYDDGYMLISATKNYYPVLAIVDHGAFTGEETNTGYDVLMNEYMVATEAAVDGEILIEGNPWARYEGVLFEKPVETKVSDEYYEVVNQYTGEWYQAGYNIYFLNQKPENMPDDMYAEFCDYASDYDRYDHDYMRCSFIIEYGIEDATFVYPLCQTKWDQNAPYNMSLNSPTTPLGCTTIAAAQIMRKLEHPTYYNWNVFANQLYEFLPRTANDTLLSNFLVQLRSDIGVNNQGGATINQVKDALVNDYGYNSANNWSVQKVSHGDVNLTLSLDRSIPILMVGNNLYSTKGHAWVCDGYSYVANYTRYSLFVIPMDDEITWLKEIETRDIYNGSVFLYHMNWGWNGLYDGYFQDSYLFINAGSYENPDYRDYCQNRKDLVFERL